MTEPANAPRPHPADPIYSQAARVVLQAGRPSISLLIRTFAIPYSRATKLVLAMEGDVIADGELARYTTHLERATGRTFALRRLALRDDLPGPGATPH